MDNTFTFDTFPAVISAPCRLHGKNIMLYSKIRQDVTYSYRITIPHPTVVVYGNMFYCYTFFSNCDNITVYLNVNGRFRNCYLD